MIHDEVAPYPVCVHDDPRRRDDDRCRERRAIIAQRRVPAFLALAQARREAERYFAEAA